jgi:hypothetical protein
MVPPIPTDQDEGTLLDGNARSAQRRDREAERQAIEAHKAARANGDHDGELEDTRYSPPTEFAGGLMIPADQLPREVGVPAKPSVTSDTFMQDPITRTAGAETEAPDGGDNRQTATDRFFERQAVSLTRHVAR